MNYYVLVVHYVSMTHFFRLYLLCLFVVFLYFQEFSLLKIFNAILRLPGTYAAKIDKIRSPSHVSLTNSVARPYFKNLTGNIFTKWPTMSKVCLLGKKTPLRFFKYGLVTELLREMCKGGLIFIYYSGIYAW